MNSPAEQYASKAEQKQHEYAHEHKDNPNVRAALARHYQVNDQFANSYDSLLNIYRKHPFGQHHANQRPRYMQRYPYNHAHALIDLGDDIHPVEHMQFTHDHVTIPYILGQIAIGDDTLTPKAITTLRLMAVTHDLGECTHPEAGTSPGDNAWDEHTDESIQEEVATWHTVLAATGIGDVLPAGTVPALESVVGKGKNTAIERHFEIIERTGYFMTAAQAAKIAVGALHRSDTRTDRLTELALRVGDGHRDFLLHTATAFPEQYIEETADSFAELKSLVGIEI